ncbi:uncharacterized protein [Diabrotica undecimpunctata]|uniref:uncharacterized protein n=1 Tax=Diabrotica undecimpunctata TaxID=50387 RepID=UPI003B636628
MEVDEEMQEIGHTSKKIENISKKEGIREGISAGRDSNFQESFDKGFEEGFKNGFLLGQYRGILMSQSRQTNVEEKVHPVLENISLGSCEVCKNNDISKDEDNIDNIIEVQSKAFKDNIQILKTFYGDITRGDN